MGKKDHGIDPERLNDYCSEIAAIHKMGVQVAIVIGGGNIFRGLQGASEGYDRVKGDYMGMMATVINSMALESALTAEGVKVMHLSGFEIKPLCERMSRANASQALENKYIVIISGGTGNPFFTTDTASALRAVEIQADVMLKGTRVDGVYSDDPEKNNEAEKYDRISFKEAYEKKLHIMDMTAFTLCHENNLPVLVFDINKKGNLTRLIKGENIGTLVQN